VKVSVNLPAASTPFTMSNIDLSPMTSSVSPNPTWQALNGTLTTMAGTTQSTFITITANAPATVPIPFGTGGTYTFSFTVPAGITTADLLSCSYFVQFFDNGTPTPNPVSPVAVVTVNAGDVTQGSPTTVTVTNNQFMLNASCLIEDTMVLTSNGYVAIQDLNAGDIAIVSNGCDDYRSVPIKDIIKVPAVSSPETDPYLFKANCFSDSYPPMDTYLSPHHCILINNKWDSVYSDNKSRWTNGAHLKAYTALSDNIQQVKIADSFNYYHIYMPDYMTDHLIINNGLIVESYGIDYKDRVIITTDAIDERLFMLSVSL